MFISMQTGQLEEIARGNPQWPQAFYGMSQVIDLENEDILAARCTYNSTERNSTTYFGKRTKVIIFIDTKY